MPSLLSVLLVLGLQAQEVPRWETSPQSAGMLVDVEGKATWGATLDIHRYAEGTTIDSIRERLVGLPKNVREQHQPSTIVQIDQDAANQAEHEHGQIGDHRNRPHRRFRSGQLQYEPKQPNLIHAVPDLRNDLTTEQQGEITILKEGERILGEIAGTGLRHLLLDLRSIVFYIQCETLLVTCRFLLY